jgi:hypothetical protein
MNGRIALLLLTLLLGFSEVAPPVVGVTQLVLGPGGTLFKALPTEDEPVDLVALNAHRNDPNDRESATIAIAATGTVCLVVNGAPINPLFPFGARFRDRINIDLGVIGGNPTLVVAPGGPSAAPIRFYSNPGPNPTLLSEVTTYSASSPRGRFVAMANLIGDDSDELLVSPGQQGPGTVDAIDHTGRFLFSLTPFPGFQGDIQVSAGDILRNDGFSEAAFNKLIDGEVSVYEFVNGDVPVPIGTGFPYSTPQPDGISTDLVDVNGDRSADLITAGSGGHVRIFGFAGATPSVLGNLVIPGLPGPIDVAGSKVDGNPAVFATRGPTLSAFERRPPSVIFELNRHFGGQTPFGEGVLTGITIAALLGP